MKTKKSISPIRTVLIVLLASALLSLGASCSKKPTPPPTPAPTPLQLVVGTWMATDIQFHDSKNNHQWFSKGTDQNWMQSWLFTTITFNSSGSANSDYPGGSVPFTISSNSLDIKFLNNEQVYYVKVLTSSQFIIGQVQSPPTGYGSGSAHIVADSVQVVYKKQ
jgi:hypothetical protein